MQKNEVIDLAIEDITHEGNGIGRHKGLAVFVPASAPGDILRVRLVKVLKNHAFGIIDDIVKAGPDRISSDCPVSGRCGGCSLLHLSYAAELRAKESWVSSNMRRIGGIALDPEPILPSPAAEGYRNKGMFPVRSGKNGQVEIGMFAPRSHTLVPITECRLHPPFFGEILGGVKNFMEEYSLAPYDEKFLSGLVRHVYIRWGEATGQVMVCLVLNGRSLPHSSALIQKLRGICPGLSSFCINSNPRSTNVILGQETLCLYGKPFIEDELCGVTLNLSPQSFYQVNRGAAESLYGQAIEYAQCQGGELLVDLYCGTGAIGLAFAPFVGQVIGVETVPQAVENAWENARQNGRDNIRFLQGDAAKAALQLEMEGLRPDIVVVDPPRKGCDSIVLESAARMSPEKFLYISCDSATLARDCKLMAELGYHLVRYRPVDLFPRTTGVETVALLARE